MPMPQGTYLKVKAGDRNKASAGRSKQSVAAANAEKEAKFYEALDKISESKLAAWNKEMAALASAIKKGEPLAQGQKVNKAISEILGEVKKVLERARDYQSLDASLRRPSETVIRAPSRPGSMGVELGLVIALVQVLSVLVRLRKGKSER